MCLAIVATEAGIFWTLSRYSSLLLVECCSLASPQQTGAVATDYYRDSDLTVGGVVNLWGRKLLLCDCDQFTKEYYFSKYGIGTLQLLPVVHACDVVSPLPPRHLPCSGYV